MTDTRDINAGMRAHFMQKANLPKKQIAEANFFLSHIKDAGHPTQAEVQTGRQLLQTLEARTELYEFYAAVRAGQEAASDSELDKRVTAIAKSVEPAEKATENLRRVLETV